MNDNNDTPVDEIKTQHTKEMHSTPEEYYNKPDCIYLRLQWFPERESFQFEIKNELLRGFKEGEPIPADIYKLMCFIRGTAEFALAYPNRMYELGAHAQNMEKIANAEELSDMQKDLLSGPVMGRA